VINSSHTIKFILLTLGCVLCSPLMSQTYGQRLVAVLVPVAGSEVPRQYLGIAREIQEEVIAGSRSHAVIDRVSLDRILSEHSFQQSGQVDFEGARSIGRIAGAQFACVSELNMDARGWISAAISVVNVGTGEVTRFENDPVPRDNQVAFNRLIEDLTSQAFGVIGTRYVASREPVATKVPRAPRQPRERRERYESDWYFGVMGSWVNPAGSMTWSAKQGFGAGLFVEKPLDSEQSLRVMGEYLSFGEKKYSRSYYDYDYKEKVSVINVSADYTYRPDYFDQAYALVGLGFVNIKTESAYNVRNQGWDDWDSHSKSGLSYFAGVGYNFTPNLGLELRYTVGPTPNYFDDYEFDSIFAPRWYTASVNYRFGAGGGGSYRGERSRSYSGFDGDVRFGVKASLAQPLGNIDKWNPYGADEATNMGSLGFGGGLFVEVPLSEKMSLRANADYMLFGKGNNKYYDEYEFGSGRYVDSYFDNSSFTPSVLGGGLDVLFHLDYADSGLYFLAGLGFAQASGKHGWESRWEVVDTTDGEIINDYYEKDSKTFKNTGLTAAVGLGYNFNRNVGFELKYTFQGPEVGPKPSDGDWYDPDYNKKPKFTWLTGSLVYRF